MQELGTDPRVDTGQPLDAEYFRLKAARCRRFAASILTRDDAASASLFALAAECERDADALDAATQCRGRPHDITPAGRMPDHVVGAVLSHLRSVRCIAAVFGASAQDAGAWGRLSQTSSGEQQEAIAAATLGMGRARPYRARVRTHNQ
jgi:hypothetical protein